MSGGMMTHWVAGLLTVGLSVGAGAWAGEPSAAGAAGTAGTPEAPRPGATSLPDSNGVLDCTNWRYGPADEPAPGVLPAEYDRDNYKRTSRRDPRPELADSPQNHCGQKGAATDLAWGISKGRRDVLIAVLDSGIEWRNRAAMDDLRTAAFINVGEAVPACTSTTGDCNGDGRFDIRDFGAIPDRNGNGLADPEDLILDPAFSDGVDDDGNGYVDDISGWDFLYGDNNPLDTVEYGHGTGEAEDSTAVEGEGGDLGVCMRCAFLPVRVGDSFIADGGRFAAGVLFAVDSGADVVQEALGTISNPRQAQRAIDAAYARGVPIVASMADEASKHPNLPASLEHTMAVNSVTVREDFLSGTNDGWLALNGCTNFGGHTWVTIPSGACSSEATGQSAGMMGLVQSVARDAGVAYHRSLPENPAGNRLSANEAMQVMRATADDIDFSTPNALDPANNFGTPSGGLLDTVRYPTTPGWDATFGFGRANTYEALKAVRAGRIPPEADISRPRWFSVQPTTGTLEVRGSVAATRARRYDLRVEWAVGLQAPAYPATDVWHVVRDDKRLRHARKGVLARIDLAAVAAALPGNGTGVPLDPTTGRPDEERFTVRVRVVVTARGGVTNGLRGIFQKTLFVHDDPDLVEGFPRFEPGVSTAQPVFAQLDADPAMELVVATDSGVIHAFDADRSEVPGWPAYMPVAPWWPSRSPTAIAAGIRPVRGSVAVGAPAATDVDGDGSVEIVAADLNGNVVVFGADGDVRAQMQVDPAYSIDSVLTQDERNRTMRGFSSSPVVAQLDGTGPREIVAAALDRHVYAWHADGTPVPGFPVLLVDPAKVDAVDPASHRVDFVAGSGVREGGSLIATVAATDMDDDGRDELIVGAQEQYQEPINIGNGGSALAVMQSVSTVGNTRLYAISPDGTNATNPDTNPAHPAEQAYLPGWPVKLGMLALESLPTLGGGVATQAAIADVAPSPGREIVAASAVGPVYVLDTAGNSVYGTDDEGNDIPLTWAGGLAGEGNDRFGADRNSEDIVASIASFSGPAAGDLDGDGTADVAAPTGGLTRLLDVQAADLQLPNDDQLSAWSGTDGSQLRGFPRATSDMAFFVTPAITDVDADGTNEVVAGNGVWMLDAYDHTGRAPAGWPKLTGGWLVGTPSFGDFDGDGRLEVAAARRDGFLLMWHTGATSAGEWPRFGGNGANTGELAGG